jgi:tRNA A-37 threonylcarbamoyl transferase component Bud32
MTEPLDRLQAALADRYRVERELGAGGMATVYLAEDLKHHRKVAVKVLHPELAAVLGAERFLVEIQTTANLQHPHILPLHDSGQAAGLLFYVMPYVEGESLRQRLARERQLPIDDAVRITREVASALDYAHRHGVIHRDIKPENILLHEGQALIADFGIALAVSSAGGQRMTQTGMSLGTPEYMSPEQALGERTLTARSDVYSLGCVLYEMLTGEPPFTGATVQALIAKMMSERPVPPSKVRDTVPPQVEAAVLGALAKLPADRLESAARFAEALDGRGGPGSPAMPPLPPTARAQPIGRLALAALALAATGAVVGRLSKPDGPPAPEVYDVALPDSAPMAATANRWGSTELTVAPDGSFVVYTARRGSGTELWWRSLRSAEARPLSGTAGAHGPVLSPDGDRVAFAADGQLRIAPVGSGPVVTVAKIGEDVGIAWPSPDSILVAAEVGFVMRWFSPGGRELGQESVLLCWNPTWLAARHRYLCQQEQVFWTAAGDSTAHWVSVGDARTKTQFLRGSGLNFLDDRHLVALSRDGRLQVMTWDGNQQVGPATTVVTGIRQENTTYAAQLALSASGTLVYAPGENAARGVLVARAENGDVEELLTDPSPIQRWDFSRDAGMVVAVIDRPDGHEVLVVERSTGRSWAWLRSSATGLPQAPFWLPDGQVGLTLGSWFADPGGAWVVGDPRAATPPDTVLPQVPYVWGVLSRDSLLVGTLAPPLFGGLLHRSGGAWTTDTLLAQMTAWGLSLSPDRRWVALTTQRDNVYQVLITPFPGGGKAYRVSTGAGLEPLWLSARELAYRNDRTWYRVPISSTSGDPVGRAVEWFTDPAFIDTPGWSNTLLADGRMVYLRSTSPATASFLRVVPGFRAAALKALPR